MMQHLLLGTAGHIDHGKTSLVHALTGVNTDTLPDEQQRGISIDLGFASLPLDGLSIGIVDVPGHERFIKNMLAGAAGIDLAMLVIAADDGIMPQTREHLEILSYLQLQSGVIAITKCDLVDHEWLDLVESEVRQLTKGSFLEHAEVIRVSTSRDDTSPNSGINRLRAAISKAAHSVAAGKQTDSPRPFRMAVDRAFALEGLGTVVTGSIASGQVSVGDELELQPAVDSNMKLLRVRGLQTHSKEVNCLGRGQRAAINLAGAHYKSISRGQTLASCGALHPSKLITLRLQFSKELARPLKNRSLVRLHVGAASLAGRILFLDVPQGEAEAHATAQLLLSQPVATVWGQPVVIRSVSPVATLGGGCVVDPLAKRIRRFTEEFKRRLADLSSGNPAERAAASAYLQGTNDWQPSDWRTLSGITDYQQLANELVEQKQLISMPNKLSGSAYLHADIAKNLESRIVRLLKAEHCETPLRQFVEQSRLARHFQRVPDALLESLCLAMQERGILRLDKKGLCLTNWLPQLSTEEQQILEQIRSLYHAAEMRPTTLGQIADTLEQPSKVVSALADCAVESGQLVRISKEFLVDSAAQQRAQGLITAKLEVQPLTVSEIRELLDTSRKFVVPYCEYLDSIGVTRRKGNLRLLSELAQG